MTNQTILSRGQRSRLADLGLDSHVFNIGIDIEHSGLIVDAACFGLDAQRRLSDERYMIFFNQPETPCGGVKQTAPTRFGFDLSRLPGSIDALVVTLAIDGSGVMSSLGSCRATFGSAAAFLFDGTCFANERAVMLVELYRKDGQWRVAAVAQGFNGGLEALVTHFGGAVHATEQAAPPPLPQSAPGLVPSKITLKKPSDTHRVALEKAPGAPRKIIVKATWTDNGDGSDDNDDLDLRVGLLLPSGQMKFIRAPDQPGAFDIAPYVRHLGDVTSASAEAPATETVEVNPEISQRLGGPVALVFSVYSAIGNGMVSVASMSPKMIMEYGNQVVECAFDFKGSSAPDIYTYVIGLIEIDSDSIALSPSGLTSEPGDEWTPWLTRQAKNVTVSVDGPAIFKVDDDDADDDDSEMLNPDHPHRRYTP
jgi:tellurite resistance protein TerA